MHLVKTFIWILAFGSLTGTSYAQTGWVIQTNPLAIESIPLGKIQFVSSTEGWISADYGILLHTINTGANWTEVHPFPSDAVSSLADPAITMSWVNQTHGWKINFMATPQTEILGAVIHKTTDGGSTWEKKVLSSVTNDIGLQVQFVDENNGWASIYNFSSGYSHLMHSTNGGNDWSLINADIVGNFYFVDANNGWMISGSNISTNPSPPYYIRHTTNGGADWSVQYTDNTASGLKRLQFTDLNNGWVAGDSAKILKTTNGGSNWTPITNAGISSGTKSKCLFFLDANTGWIGHNNQVITHTTDGGSSWTQQHPPTTSSVFSIFFWDENNGWFTNDGSNIYHTTSGGATGVEEGSNSIPSGYSLSQNYPNPFNPSTSISFSVGTYSYTSLRVYDMLGREVTIIFSGEMSAGSYTKQWNANGMPSGVYFYRLSVVPSARRDLVPTEGRNGQSGYFTETKKLVLLR